MGSYDITFCTNKKCKKTDCVRNHIYFERLIDNGVTYLSYAEFDEKDCSNYVKDKGYWKDGYYFD